VRNERPGNMDLFASSMARFAASIASYSVSGNQPLNLSNAAFIGALALMSSSYGREHLCIIVYTLPMTARTHGDYLSLVVACPGQTEQSLEVTFFPVN